MPKNTKDETGNRYGRLVVAKRHDATKRGLATWLCLCDCGRERVATGAKLRQGSTTTCGHCKRAERLTTHGLRYHPLYNTYKNMVNRCYNTRCKAYAAYGGRGIRVCDRWLGSRELFFSDMGERPSNKHSIDRIDNNGHYEPGNCRWANKTVQNNNQRRTKVLVIDGSPMTLTECSSRFGVGENTIYYRLKGGWSDEMAAKTPVEAKFKRKHRDAEEGTSPRP